MIEEANNDDGVTLVSGSKQELDENLTDEELRALEEFDDAIANQRDPDTLDKRTLDTLGKIWIVRKSRGFISPVIKVIWGVPIFKRDDFI